MKQRAGFLLLVAMVIVVPMATGSREFFGADSHMPMSGPDALKKLANHDARVAGDVWFADYFAYYAGDTEKLNAFLRQYDDTVDTNATLVLHAGRRTYSWPPDGNTEITGEADWMMHVSQHTPGRPNEAAFKGEEFLITLHVWLGGQTDMKELEVPLSMDVRSGREIEGFVERHKKNQEAVEDQRGDGQDERQER